MTREYLASVHSVDRNVGRVLQTLDELDLSDRTIVISCLPGFAFNWLFPRLLRFDMAHPDLSISIATDTGQYPFSGSDADVGIRYGLGDFPGYQVDLLMSEIKISNVSW